MYTDVVGFSFVNMSYAYIIYTYIIHKAKIT